MKAKTGAEQFKTVVIIFFVDERLPQGFSNNRLHTSGGLFCYLLIASKYDQSLPVPVMANLKDQLDRSS